jgi:glycosyltransferase involved in cell wall biosynthesis
VVLTTDTVAELYAQRYPARSREQWAVIANGYGESDFETDAEEASSPLDDRPIHLVHSGFLYPFYPPGRNPRPFFAAVARLRDAGALSGDTLKVTLRGCGDVAHYQRLIDEAGVGDMVAATDSIPRREAIRELRQVDGVLVFQGSPFNPQVPVKVYEALRANKPILALTDEAGETARFVRSSEAGLVARMDSSEAIAKALKDLLERLRSGTAPTASPDEIARHSYLNRTAELAGLFDEVVRESTRR